MIIAVSIISISLAYNQEIKLATGIMISDEKPAPEIILSDPICFVTDRTSLRNTEGGVTLDTCISLEKFEEMGCTKPMLEHILRYSNLLDYEADGHIYLDWAGLPEGVSQEKFDDCFDVISEKRPILNSIFDDDLKSKEYVANCDETIHKEKLPDLIIENSTHNYDMQYCKWELKYPDLTLISNANLLNAYPYCAELFDTLFDYYHSIQDNCGIQRYYEDGTPLGICEPPIAGAGVPYDINMIKSGCAFTYDQWAYLTEHNDNVFYLFDRKEINDKIHGDLDEHVKVIDKLCEDNDYVDIKPNIKFRNNAHWIDTDHCTLNKK